MKMFEDARCARHRNQLDCTTTRSTMLRGAGQGGRSVAPCCTHQILLLSRPGAQMTLRKDHFWVRAHHEGLWCGGTAQKIARKLGARAAQRSARARSAARCVLVGWVGRSAHREEYARGLGKDHAILLLVSVLI
eukprot:SAG11_NODE_799_length_7127_cov_3.180279_11_plen_134_part_00